MACTNNACSNPECKCDPCECAPESLCECCESEE